jgi:nitrogen fixation protein NifX
MKVAFATTDGVAVDEHFGRAARFAVYEVTAGGYSYLEDRRFGTGVRDHDVESTRGMGAEHDHAVAGKVERLADCRLIYIEEIGGPSAARLSQKGIMPLKVKDLTSIEGNLARLLETVAGNPPIWLRRALGEDGT